MDRLTSMRVFQKVIDEGGFAAAARALDMSSAGVTRQIADLEDYLGTRLLHRTTRRVSLSPAGETYLGRVRSILQDIDEAHDVASSQTHELAGELRLLSPPALASHVIGPIIAGFTARYPGISLHMDVESYTTPPVEDYDITMLPTDGTYDGNVIARRVSTTQAILVASPAYLQRMGTPATPDELIRHDVLRLKAPHTSFDQWRLLNADAGDEAAHFAVKPKLWVNHSDTLVRAAVDGAGITSAAVTLVAPLLTDGTLVRVLSPWIAGHLALYAAFPSRKFMPERTRVFLEYLTAQSRARADAVLKACTRC
ncbi:LysR substrate-binding domain-containing protein [Rhodoferax saidenbachensis]|uniref:DNA-binding transcriptional LysR family regulator n=1 Tax=Rhodoferax saidenbachensis TaxID=1484693 RepID=A0ABU1ZUI6_9BURK|nr:LysR substrate-binding domain-containing protein [Rhodoferax saidenbachensis]MDR7308191.1 DNA-binding transcriptional LysR family regulator [Rhodoferax saidenbachensis]